MLWVFHNECQLVAGLRPCRLCLTSTFYISCIAFWLQNIRALPACAPVGVDTSPASVAVTLSLSHRAPHSCASWKTQVIQEWELCVHFSFTLTTLCAEISTGFSKCSSYYSVIKYFAHSTPTGEEGPTRLRLQACTEDNVIHSQ